MPNQRIQAQADPETTLEAELRQVLTANRAAMAACDTYIAINNPSAAQVTAQVRQLTQQMHGAARQNIALIRLVLRLLDATN